MSSESVNSHDVTRPSSLVEDVTRAMEQARLHVHPQRAMRVTLECAHLRLMPAISVVMGIGAMTGCSVCPHEEDGHWPARQVVNVEETGVLHDDWHKRDPSRKGS